MGKGSGTTRSSSSSNPKGFIASTISSNIAKISAKEGVYKIKDGVDAYIYERESRNYGEYGSPWIIEGGKTVFADVRTNGNTYTVSFTYDGRGNMNGIYKNKKDAVNAMKKYFKERFS